MKGYKGTADGKTCHACAIGTYKDSLGIGTCVNCDENKYSVTSAATDEASCTTCPDFTVSPAGSKQWTSCVCDAGYFRPGSFRDCEACPKGTYKEATGETSCIECPENTYQPELGQVLPSTCLDCPYHSNSDKGSGDYDDCGCHGGYFDQHAYAANTYGGNS
jgi:hypothetical protein